MAYREIIGADGESYWIDEADLPMSPAEMRSSGTLGPDRRTAALPGGSLVDVGRAVIDAAPRALDTLRAQPSLGPGGQPLEPPAPAAPNAGAAAPRAAGGAPNPGAGAPRAAGGAPDAAPEPTAGAGGPFVMRTGGGLQTTGVAIEGMTPEDKSAVRAAFDDYERGVIGLGELTERIGNLRAERQERVLGQQHRRAAEQRNEARLEEERLEKEVSDAKTELDESLRRDYDPARLWGNPWFALSAAIGGLASELLSIKRGTNTADRFWRTIHGLVEADVKRQVDTNSGLVAAAKARLGDARDGLAATIARARYWDDVANEMLVEAQLGPAETRETAMLEAKKAELVAKKHKADAVTALADRRRVQQQAVPSQTVVVNPTVEQLRMLGVSQEQWEKGLTRKVGQGGDTAPTVASTANFIKAVDEDMAVLRQLNEVGGAPSSKILWNQMSQGLRDTLQRLNINVPAEGATKAELSDQILTRRLIAEAKKMGGVITENDLKFTERVSGQSMEAKIAWLERMRRDANSELVSTIGADFPGVEQPVIDIMLGRQAATRGVPNARSLRPR